MLQECYQNLQVGSTTLFVLVYHPPEVCVCVCVCVCVRVAPCLCEGMLHGVRVSVGVCVRESGCEGVRV